MGFDTMLKDLQAELSGAVTDRFLDALLHGMELGFVLSASFRKNIENFRGRYVFNTADGFVYKAVTFENGGMEVHGFPPHEWDARVTFKNVPALKRFLFSRDQDILNSLLANEVEVDGNLNYIYKFGYMARDLGRRLGVL